MLTNYNVRKQRDIQCHQLQFHQLKIKVQGFVLIIVGEIVVKPPYETSRIWVRKAVVDPDSGALSFPRAFPKLGQAANLEAETRALKSLRIKV